MSSKLQYSNLFAYQWETTFRLLEKAELLSRDALSEENAYGHGSIQSLFFHLLQSAQSWRIGLETMAQGGGLDQAEFQTLELIKSALQQEQAAWLTYIDELSEDEIAESITLSDRRGNPRTFPLWQILQHLILHGMQHHAELARSLTEHGQSPGNLDFIYYGVR